MEKELSGKIAFVTGSGRGLGRRMAERLAELGADVAIHDRDWTAPAQYGEAADIGVVAKEMEKFGTRTCAVTGNIGEPAAVRRMKEDIFETVMIPFNYLTSLPGDELLPVCHAMKVGTVIMKPFGGGALSNATLALKFLLGDEHVDVVIPGMLSVTEVEENIAQQPK